MADRELVAPAPGEPERRFDCLRPELAAEPYRPGADPFAEQSFFAAAEQPDGAEPRPQAALDAPAAVLPSQRRTVAAAAERPDAPLPAVRARWQPEPAVSVVASEPEAESPEPAASVAVPPILALAAALPALAELPLGRRALPASPLPAAPASSPPPAEASGEKQVRAAEQPVADG